MKPFLKFLTLQLVTSMSSIEVFEVFNKDTIILNENHMLSFSILLVSLLGGWAAVTKAKSA